MKHKAALNRSIMNAIPLYNEKLIIQIERPNK